MARAEPPPPPSQRRQRSIAATLLRNHDMHGFLAASPHPALTALIAWVGASIVTARLLSARMGCAPPRRDRWGWGPAPDDPPPLVTRRYDTAAGSGEDAVGALAGAGAATMVQRVDALIDSVIAARVAAGAGERAAVERAKV